MTATWVDCGRSILGLMRFISSNLYKTGFGLGQLGIHMFKWRYGMDIHIFIKQILMNEMNNRKLGRLTSIIINELDE